jgi:hypothetical protein
MMRRSAALLLAVIVTGCGGDGGGHGDCRDDDMSCYEPFVCRASDSGEGNVCRSPEGDVPTCTGTPTESLVPLAVDPSSGIPLHWTMEGGTIDITYSDDFRSGDVTDPRVVNSNWNMSSCAADILESTNFNPLDPVLERAERRIHFQMNDVPSDTATTTVYYEIGTGRIMTALIDIDPDYASTITDREMIYLLGRALGFTDAPAGTDSVMAPDFTDIRATYNDAQAFCAMYGETGSYCGD